jgi:hypothetical protein
MLALRAHYSPLYCAAQYAPRFIGIQCQQSTISVTYQQQHGAHLVRVRLNAGVGALPAR